jgi:amino acid transporter
MSITKSEQPLGFLSQQIGLGVLGDLVEIGALVSFFACVIGSINPAARIFFLMARHGLFHARLGTAHAANRTPHIAVSLCTLVMFLVPAVMSMAGIKLFDSMGYLGAICSYGFLTVYVLIAIAAPVYLYRLRKLRTRDIGIAIASISFMMIPILGSVGVPGSTLFPPPDAPYNLFPYLFLIYIAVTCSWFIVQRFRSPEIVQSMQHSVEVIHAQFEERF